MLYMGGVGLVYSSRFSLVAKPFAFRKVFVSSRGDSVFDVLGGLNVLFKRGGKYGSRR